MKNDNISDIVAEFVRQAYPDLDLRLEAQTEALKEFSCTAPFSLGLLIDSCENVELLLSSLRLNTADYAARYPALADISRSERLLILDELESHFKNCPHCSLRRGYDLELDAHVKTVCLDNKTLLLGLLREYETALADSEAAEGDHATVTFYPEINGAACLGLASEILSPGADESTGPYLAADKDLSSN